MRIVKALLFCTMSLVPVLGCTTYRIYKSVIFDINCGGRLERAASANTIELASEELEAALLQANKYEDGYTSVFFNTPDEDVGFWKKNLNESYAELIDFKNNIDKYSATDKSNQLIKLRETLIDHTDQGDKITKPSGISIYPNNGIIFFIGTLSIIFGLVGPAWLFYVLNDESCFI